MKKLKKSLVAATLMVSLLTPVVSQAAGSIPKVASAKPVEIYINGQVQNIPDNMGKAYLDSSNGRVMIPLRYVAETMNCVVNYVPKTATQEAGFLIGNRKLFVQMNIGSHDAILRDNETSKTVTVDSPAIVYDERSYVPVRFISEVLGLKVDWKEENNLGKVLITGSLEPDQKSTENKSLNITEKDGKATMTITDKDGQEKTIHY